MKSHQGELVETMRRTVVRDSLFKAGQTVLVAVSGGPDSTALLHALAGMRAEWELKLTAAHLNHGFRGAEAEGDAEYAEQLCRSVDVPCRCEVADVPAMSRRLHVSSQVGARTARHSFLRQTADETGADLIALGHTKDDQIETVLQHILRGSGLAGLAGMTTLDPPLVRPLLHVSRSETQAYCARHSLFPRIDSSNEKPDYSRNRLRAELLPHLATYYNQRIGDSLLRLSTLAEADNRLLDELASHSLQRTVLSRSSHELRLDLAAVRALPLALQRRVVRGAIAEVRGSLQDIGMEMVENVLAAAATSQLSVFTLPSGDGASVCVGLTLAELRFWLLAPASQTLPWSRQLPLPGTLIIEAAGIIAETAQVPTMESARKRGWPGENCLLLRESDHALPLTLRSWRSGDRMRPLGLDGTKKLQDLFTDCRISGAARHRVPVLADANDRVLAVLGVRVGEQTVSPSDRETEGGGYILVTWTPYTPDSGTETGRADVVL